MVLLLLTYIGRIVGKRQTAWMEATDKRIKLLVRFSKNPTLLPGFTDHIRNMTVSKSSVISQFLLVKWSGYERILAKKIEALRHNETREAARF